MSTSLSTARVDALPEIIHALGSWQRDGLGVQLHPGDLGWAWRLGAEAVARDVRVWRSGDRIRAVGFLDGSSVIRLGLDPDADEDEALAVRIADDLGPDGGLLEGPDAAAEVRLGAALRRVLESRGWRPGERWTPLVRDLADPVEDPGVEIRIVGPTEAEERVAVHRASFPASTFTVDAWHTMAAGPAYRTARCVLALADGVPVAATTVWSAGAGRPGLIEPLGASAEHRGKGLGRAITVAAAAALRDLGASSATVATPASNERGVATYVSAGFTRMPDVADFDRPADAG